MLGEKIINNDYILMQSELGSAILNKTQKQTVWIVTFKLTIRLKMAESWSFLIAKSQITPP